MENSKNQQETVNWEMNLQDVGVVFQLLAKAPMEVGYATHESLKKALELHKVKLQAQETAKANKEDKKMRE